MFLSYFDQENKIANQPTHYGQLINIPATKDFLDSTQLWIEQPSGRMFHRGGNNSNAINDTPFKRFLDTDDLSAAGVVAGNVSNANAWWVKLGGTIPLIIQGGYNTGKSGSWAIAFPHALLGISGDYSGSNDMDWGPSISGNTTSWSAGSSGSNVRVIAIGY